MNKDFIRTNLLQSTGVYLCHSICLEMMTKAATKASLYCVVVLLFLQANADFKQDSWNSLDTEDNFDELLSLTKTERQESDQQEQGQCKTPACKWLKNSILSKMGKKISPCKDMYMYSCGGMIEKERKRVPSERVTSTFKELIDAQTKKLIKIVEGLKSRKENDAYKKVYDWYAACTNTKEKAKLGACPLLQILKDSGPWPVLDEFWDNENWDLERTLAFINRNFSASPLFELLLGNDARNVSRTPYRLSITNPSLGLSAAEFYLKKTKYSDKILYAYYRLLYKLNELIGGKNTYFGQECDPFMYFKEFFKFKCEDGLKYDVLNVIKFEMDIAKAKSLEKGTYLVSPYTTLGSLQEAYINRGFNWKRYFSLLYEDIPTQPPFKDDEVIYIEHPKVFKALMLLIETTEPRILANYIMSKVLFEWGGTLSPAFRQPYKQFYTAAYGIKTFSSIKVRCIHSVSKDLNFPVTALFVKNNLPEKDLVKAEKLVNRLTEAYLDHLDRNVEWMDNKTRNAAKKKVLNMLAHVGYPRTIRNMTVLNKLYKNIKVDPLKYFENVLRLNQVNIKEGFNKRGTYPKRDSWDMQLTSANAQYSPNKNMITVAAALLQPPLFGHDYPRARTFGSIGMAIGHEMTHGFDAYGSRFDEKGNVHQWWSNKTRKTFKKKTKCMIDEYSKFKVGDEHVRGSQTLDENIADNGGLRIAYEAYNTSLKYDGPDQSLPGIKLTSKQLFFLSYSQLWCKNVPKASAINSLHTDVHSPAKARVNVVLQNMKEFSETFNCPLGSPMNPKKKCIVW